MDIKNDTLYGNLLSAYSERNSSYTLDTRISEEALMKIIFSNFITDKDYQDHQKKYSDYILSRHTINHIDNFSYVGELYEGGFRLVKKTNDFYDRGLVCKMTNDSGEVISSQIMTSIDNFNSANLYAEFTGYFYTNNISGEFSFFANTDSYFSLIVDERMIIDISDSFSRRETVGKITLEKETYYPMRVKIYNGYGYGNGSSSLSFSHSYIHKSTDGSENFYYIANMRHDIKTSIPTVNTNIIDFDVSHYASESIKAYLFYLDCIVDLYRNVADLKDRGVSHIVNTFHIKSRYYYTDAGIKLYTRDDFYNINMRIERQGIDNMVADVSINSEMPISNVFAFFKKDVIRHLNFLNGDDIKFSDMNYIKEIHNFYMTCRLKLMYSIIHSVLLVSSTRSTDVFKTVDNTIRMLITPVFMNFKEHVLSSGDASLQNKGLLYSKEVLSTKYDIGKSNEVIASSKDILNKHKNASKFSEGNLKYKNTINVIAITTLVVVGLCFLSIFAVNADKKVKALVSIVITMMVIVVILVLKYLKQKREGFINLKVKTVVLTSAVFAMPGESGQWKSYAINPVKLPDDYIDKALISWDITVQGNVASMSSHNKIDLNIGSFKIATNAADGTVKNNKTPLNFNNAKLITGNGIVYDNPRWTNCTYRLTIRYDENKAQFINKEREDQIKYLMKMGELSRKIAEILLKEKEAEKDLLNSQNAIKNTEAEIAIMTQEYNEAKNRLDKNMSDKQAIMDAEYLRLKKELAEKTALLQRKEAEEKKLALEVAKKQADAERDLNNLNRETNLKNISIANTQADLDLLRNRALREFGEFISASDKAELAEVTYLNADNAWRIIKLTLEEKKDGILNEMSLRQAKFILDAARLDRDKKSVDENTAKINYERTALELENKRKALVAEQLQRANDELNKKVEFEKYVYEDASVKEEMAKNQKIMAENNASINLIKIGEKHGVNVGNIETLNSILETKIAHEKEQRAMLEKETAKERLREIGNVSIEASANAIIAVNNKLITDTDKSIAVYENALSISRKKLAEVQNNKRTLENDLATAIASAAVMKEMAENKFNEMDMRTRLVINKLMEERLILRTELIRLTLIKEKHTRESLEERQLKEELLSKLDSMMQEISAVQTEADYYDTLTENIELVDLLRDVDASILYNVNVSINTTNNDMVLPRLQKEKEYFKKYSEITKQSARLSGTDINVKDVDKKSVHAVNDLLLNLTLAMAMGITVFYNVSLRVGAVVAFIGASVSGTYYIVESNRIVRTKARHHYWSQPGTFA